MFIFIEGARDNLEDFSWGRGFEDEVEVDLSISTQEGREGGGREEECGMRSAQNADIAHEV